MADKETGWFRGEGGGVWEMDLPLSEDLRNQLTKGYLTRVNEDGNTYDDGQPAPADVEDEPVSQAVVPRPAPSAAKSAWVGYVVRTTGMAPDDAEALTKQDLIDVADKNPKEG